MPLLLEAETENGLEFIDVPLNDYRSIRRSILDIQKFEINYAQLRQEEIGGSSNQNTI